MFLLQLTEPVLQQTLRSQLRGGHTHLSSRLCSTAAHIGDGSDGASSSAMTDVVESHTGPSPAVATTAKLIAAFTTACPAGDVLLVEEYTTFWVNGVGLPEFVFGVHYNRRVNHVEVRACWLCARNPLLDGFTSACKLESHVLCLLR